MSRRLHLIVPVLAAAVLAGALLLPTGNGVVLAALLALMAAVVTAVHHAEVVALRVGEPFGTLVLALAVTVIEVALILTLMLAGGEQRASLPRDTIYSAVMIICNGVVGICLLLGGLRHREQSFRIEGAGSGIAALIALATLSLVLPTFTISSPAGTYTDSQLLFVGASSLVLWGVFVFVQTVRHRDYFLPQANPEDEMAHAAPPVLVAIAIAMLVLLPETYAAVRAARANRLQTSLNLAIGSALASIGLTIPVVVGAAVWLGLPLTLGLEARDITLLALTFLVATVTLGSGKTTLMQGAVHLVLFAAFLFLSLVP